MLTPLQRELFSEVLEPIVSVKCPVVDADGFPDKTPDPCAGSDGSFNYQTVWIFVCWDNPGRRA